MKRFLVFIFLVAMGYGAFSQTQSEMTSNSKSKLENARVEMDSILVEIKNLHPSDQVFHDAVDAAQSAWDQSRIADIKMKFPSREPGYYGSNHSMCLNLFALELTEDRIAFLKRWFVEEEEKSGCSGTMTN